MLNKKLGYYTVNELEFESKIRACIHITQNNLPESALKWHFNDFEFSSFDWSVEPHETLDQLYDARARELREKYDYLILSYSAGADSHNILMSFLRQGLHIDELLVNTFDSALKNVEVSETNKASTSAPQSEHHLQTIPRLKEVAIMSPNTKITILDMSDHLFNFHDYYKDESWVLNRKEGLNPLNVTRFNYVYIDQVKKQFDKSKKIGIIAGIEKPRVLIDKDNTVYTYFSDKATNIAPITDNAKDYDNATLELFYWAPESLRMISKQVHTIKNLIETNSLYRSFFKGQTFQTHRLIVEPLLRGVLYPTTWNNDWYQAEKAVSDWFSEFDHWFIFGHKGTKAHDLWYSGIKYVGENAGTFVRKDAQGRAVGIKPILKYYKIGQLNVIPNQIS
jgi:hypothetical protein